MTSEGARIVDDQNNESGSHFPDHIFEKGMHVWKAGPASRFNLNAVALLKISRAVYQHLRANDVQLSKKLTPEYLDYYHTFCLWARIVDLKRKNQESLTEAENRLLGIVNQREYRIAEPIFIFLRGIGNITHITGDKLCPAFPSLPTSVVSNKGGFYGEITLNTHNLYEEIPCLGVLAEAVQYSVSNQQSGLYPSVLSTANAKVNGNLLGYRPLGFRKEEVKNLARAYEITENSFPSTPTNTAINIGFINSISDMLSTLQTFKMIRTNFMNLSVSGAPCQIVITERDFPSHEPDVVSDLVASSVSRETPGTFGGAIYAAYQLIKSVPRNNWLCINTPEPVAYPDPYAAWVDCRNERRNLPEQYRRPAFVVCSENAGMFRDSIIASLVTGGAFVNE